MTRWVGWMGKGTKTGITPTCVLTFNVTHIFHGNGASSCNVAKFCNTKAHNFEHGSCFSVFFINFYFYLNSRLLFNSHVDTYHLHCTDNFIINLFHPSNPLGGWKETAEERKIFWFSLAGFIHCFASSFTSWSSNFRAFIRHCCLTCSINRVHSISPATRQLNN